MGGHIVADGGITCPGDAAKVGVCIHGNDMHMHMHMSFFHACILYTLLGRVAGAGDASISHDVPAHACLGLGLRLELGLRLGLGLRAVSYTHLTLPTNLRV